MKTEDKDGTVVTALSNFTFKPTRQVVGEKSGFIVAVKIFEEKDRYVLFFTI